MSLVTCCSIKFLVLLVIIHNTMNHLSSMALQDMQRLFCALIVAPTLVVPLWHAAVTQSAAQASPGMCTAVKHRTGVVAP